MIELLLGGIEPPKQPLILLVTEPVIVQVEPPEPTIEEKIASDYYKCEPLRYIRADTAECGDIRPEYRVSESVSVAERTNTPTSTKNTPQTIKSASGLAIAPAGWYPVNQCTHHVWTKRPVGRWNNASEWYRQAKRDGWSTGTTPQVGAIGVQKSGNHVVFIQAVEGDRVYISERNHDNRGSYRESWQPASKYNYIY